MKKILTIIIWLVFSNNAFALGSFFNPTVGRCSIIYTKINLHNSATKDKYITTQFDLEFNPNGGWTIADPCYKGGKKLAKKINKWMKKDPGNSALSEITSVSCKRRTPGIFSNSWSKYKVCEDLYYELMTNKWLKFPDRPDRYTKKIIHSKKIIKNHQE
jgi:hypothetical protein